MTPVFWEKAGKIFDRVSPENGERYLNVLHSFCKSLEVNSFCLREPNDHTWKAIGQFEGLLMAEREWGEIAPKELLLLDTTMYHIVSNKEDLRKALTEWAEKY